MSEAIVQAINKKFQQSQRVLILTHLKPDGDAIGSLLGLGIAMRANGKIVQMVSRDGVPGSLRYLTDSDKILKQVAGDFDLSVVVDCSDLERVGVPFTNQFLPDINIDHHITNQNFAKLNLVEPEAAATAEILGHYFLEWGLPLAPAADPLMTGLVTDTIGFRTNNVGARTLRLAADFIDAGSNLAEIYRRALLQKSLSAIRYWGRGLGNLNSENGLVWTSLTLSDRKESAYPGRDDADLINLLSFTDGIEIALIFIEQPDGRVKVSWRAQDKKDVSEIAQRFGGGGHRAAAGAEILGTLAEVQPLVLAETRKLID
jgi:bifunctional oligoribonuclease and PAP phosphatase NrnA